MLKILRSIIDAARFARSIERSAQLANEGATTRIANPQAMMQRAYEEAFDHEDAVGRRKPTPPDAYVEPLPAASLREMPR